MNKIARLRELLAKPGIIVAPGVYDCVGARLVEEAGFDVAYMTGNGTVASKIGKPDIGLATMSQMAEWAGSIASSIDIPLISDADNGYGDLNNVRYAVQQFEQAGASAIHLEDQGFPKKCGAMEGVGVISAEEAAEKIKIAVKSRKEMLIIARSDCMSVYHDLDEMIRRMKLYEAAGADVLFPEMLENLDQLRAICGAVKLPVMFDILECVGKDNIPTIKELEDAGAKIAINALSLMWYNCTNMRQKLADFKATGDLRRHFSEAMDIHEYERLMGIESAKNIRKLL